jgi:hypothetical protein
MGQGCAIKQACFIQDDRIFAPGYCRRCRSNKWARKQEGFPNVGKLFDKVTEENELKFDMLVFFDEALHSIESLDRTLGTGWFVPYAQKAIIMDVTGFGKRKNIALQYIQGCKKPIIPCRVDSSVACESFSQRECTIKRLSTQVTAPFFLTIPAGNMIKNMDLLAKNVQYVPSRVIQWTFPMIVGSTVVVPAMSHCGLFITKPYMALTKKTEAKVFSEQLTIEEKETEMGLSWFCYECGLV